MSHGKTRPGLRNRGPGDSLGARVGPVVTAAMASVLLLTSCAGPPAGPGRPATSDVTKSGPANGSSAIASRPAQPGPSGLPPVTCVRFVGTAPCTPYRSVRVLEAGKALPWGADGGLTASLQSINGELMLLLRTPCAPASAKAALQDDILRVRDIAVGAAGCPAEQGRQQGWLLDLLAKDLTVSYTGRTLHWRAGTSGIDFEVDPL